MIVSGIPLMIEMNNWIFKGEGNQAEKGGNTLYIVWKSTMDMNREDFSSFAELNEEEEEEVKVERWNGKIVGMGELMKGGWRSGYGVCAYIEISEKVGRLTVEVVDGEGEGEEEGEGEGSGEKRCIIGMEGGEVEMGGEVRGEVNGGGVVVDMGREMKKIMEGSEDIEIVMNVTYGLSNG